MNHTLVIPFIPYRALGACIALVLLGIDLTFLTFFKNPSVISLISFTLISFLYKRFSFYLFFNFFLIAIYGFIATGLVIPYFSFFVMILFIAKFCSFYFPYRFLLCALTITSIFFYPYLFKSSYFAYSSYTTFVIIANLIIINFSLKWSPAVK